jgi:hypothetical protein
LRGDIIEDRMVGRTQEVRDFARGVNERVDVFGAALGRMVHEMDGLSRRLAIAEERLAGLVPMVIDTSYEEPSVEFETDVGQYDGVREEVLIGNMVRTLIPIEDEPQVGDSPPLRFTRSLRHLDELVEELVDRSQARELSDYGTAPLGDLDELFQL